jgi:hypothetical protein
VDKESICCNESQNFKSNKILKGKVILRRLEFEISVFIFKWIVKKVNQLNLPLAERIEQEKNANLSNLSLK